MENNELMAELKDIISRISAYHALHKEGCFLFRFVGFKKTEDLDNKICDDCENCEDCEGCLEWWCVWRHRNFKIDVQ